MTKDFIGNYAYMYRSNAKKYNFQFGGAKHNTHMLNLFKKHLYKLLLLLTSVHLLNNYLCYIFVVL